MEFSLDCALACTSWGLVAGLIGWYWVTGDIRPAACGVAASSAAATVTVRLFHLKAMDEFDRRMRNAFDLGREAGRTDSRRGSIRSIND